MANEAMKAKKISPERAGGENEDEPQPDQPFARPEDGQRHADDVAARPKKSLADRCEGIG